MKKKNEQNFRETWNHKCSKICVMGVSEEEKEKEIFKSMANFFHIESKILIHTCKKPSELHVE